MVRRYPHLLPEDVPVWEDYLKRHPGLYSFIEYDVRLGLGRDPGPEFEGNIRQMAVDLSMRRADAVGFMDDEIVVIEITTVADMTALGQVQAYPILYKLTYSPVNKVSGLLVMREWGTDLKVVADVLGIRYELVPMSTA